MIPITAALPDTMSPLEKINTDPDTWYTAIEIETHFPPLSLPAKENISSWLSHDKYKTIPFLSCFRAMSTPQLSVIKYSRVGTGVGTAQNKALVHYSPDCMIIPKQIHRK